MNEHICQGVIVGCMDWRVASFRAAAIAALYDESPRRFDQIYVPGGVKQFLEYHQSGQPCSIKEPITWGAEVADKLHGTKTFHIVGHHDCGACGGFANFGHDHRREMSHHRNELNDAAAVLEQMQGPADTIVEQYFESFDAELTVYTLTSFTTEAMVRVNMHDSSIEEIQRQVRAA